MSAEHVGFWAGILETAQGAGRFRFVLQPLMAIFLGVRIGIADAKEGKDPFVARLLLTGKNKAQVAKEALTRVLIPFTIAIVIDAILQYITLGRIRLGAAVVVGAVLIWIPFGIVRGLSNRAYRRTHHDHHDHHDHSPPTPAAPSHP